MTPVRFIEALGLATPAPGDQREQVAALFTGAPLFQRHPTWIGPDGQRQIMGFLSDLRDLSDFPRRLAVLLNRAYLDCRQDRLDRDGQPAAAPLVVQLPEVLRQQAFADAFRDAAAQLDFTGVTKVHLLFGGAAAGLALLGQLQLDPAQPRAYVAAADSLVPPFMLDFLAAQGLLRDRHSPWNPIPAEAAAVLLLSSQGGFAQLRGWGAAQETQRLADPDRALLGRALCGAIDATLAMAGASPDEVICDAGPERWRAEELGIVRSQRTFLVAERLPWHHITQGSGDLGVATGLVSVAAACHRPCASLILSGGRFGDRAAALIDASGQLQMKGSLSEDDPVPGI